MASENKLASAHITGIEVGERITIDMRVSIDLGALEQELDVRLKPKPDAEEQIEFAVEPEPEPEPEKNRLKTASPAAELDPIGTDPADSWSLTCRGEDRALGHRAVVVGDTVYVGGEFDGASPRNGSKRIDCGNLVGLDRETGEPTAFAPELDGDVRALALSPDARVLYVGGNFTAVGGEARSRIAAFDTSSGDLLPFALPKIDRRVHALAATAARLYAGGIMSTVAGSPCSSVVAFDVHTGEQIKSFAPDIDGKVSAVVPAKRGLWIGGAFSAVSGEKQRGLALLDADTGNLIPTRGAGHDVIDMVADDDTLYLAIGGPGGRATALDVKTGKLRWTISSDGNFQAVAVDEGRFVYLGGHFNSVAGNNDLRRMIRVDKRTGELDTSWQPRMNGKRSVNGLHVDARGLTVVGDFTMCGGEDRGAVAILHGDTR